MALIESLKAFYKDNVENVDKLNDADSILEVLRAKYGNYKGSNIEEYFKELVNNGISPGGGGGGDFPKLIIDTVQQTLSCDTTYSDCAELLANSPVIGAYPIIICFGDTPSSFANMYDHTENNYIRISRGTDELYYLSDGTITVGKPE